MQMIEDVIILDVCQTSTRVRFRVDELFYYFVLLSSLYPEFLHMVRVYKIY